MVNKYFIILLIVLFSGKTLNAQVESEVIKITDDNCATNLGKNYMVKMGIIDSSEINKRGLRVREILKRSKFEEEKNGIFLISNLSAHRSNLILLKRSDEVKLLTFCDISHSMLELISFLDNIGTNDKDLVNYIDTIMEYISTSKQTIKIRFDLIDSDWILCK
jgi:hypothetical protein